MVGWRHAVCWRKTHNEFHSDRFTYDPGLQSLCEVLRENTFLAIRLFHAQQPTFVLQRSHLTPMINKSTHVSCLRQTTAELWRLSGGKRGDYQNCSVLYCVLKLCSHKQSCYQGLSLRDQGQGHVNFSRPRQGHIIISRPTSRPTETGTITSQNLHCNNRDEIIPTK